VCAGLDGALDGVRAVRWTVYRYTASHPDGAWEGDRAVVAISTSPVRSNSL
jgi:hypothetical protein